MSKYIIDICENAKNTKPRTSWVKRIGQRFCSRDYGWYEVTSVKKSPDGNNCIVRIKFDTTGYECDVKSHSVAKGMAKDATQATVFGVGKVFKGAYAQDPAAYTKWYSAMRRCYSEVSLKKDPSYMDASVCDRWHSIENFYNDMSQIPGYDQWRKEINSFGFSNMQLDKDILVEGNKVYGPGLVCFVNPEDNLEKSKKNCKIKNSKPVKNILTGEIFESIVAAALKTGTRRLKITQHCKNRVKSPEWKYIK